jgi:tetratricopeptide (TPR) repeat protein
MRMVESGLHDSDVHARVKHAVELTREENYEQALEIFEEHLPSLTAGTITDKRAAAAAMSYYGLCIAMIRRKYSDAVRCCQISVNSNMFEPDHRYNLAMVFLERGDRRGAVETLNAGLRLRPNHTQIHRLFNEIGRRRPPVLPFLSRGNPLNVWLGKKLRGPHSR